jgi:hypothetical protein
MGKRSNFERIERDYYPTPYEAVLPLIPHLKRHGIETFAEPCAGDGALARHLQLHGLQCASASDIAHGEDALEQREFEGEAIITNPPYERKLMHALIEHFRKQKPTWLLLEWDWAATKQAVPHLEFCSHIVVVGRLKIIPDSPHYGKENFAWYRFQSYPGQPRLHPRLTTESAGLPTSSRSPARHLRSRDPAPA